VKAVAKGAKLDAVGMDFRELFDMELRKNRQTCTGEGLSSAKAVEAALAREWHESTGEFVQRRGCHGGGIAAKRGVLTD